VYNRHDQDSVRLDPIYQPIAVNEPLSDMLASNLRNNATKTRKLRETTRHRQYFGDHSTSIILRIPGNIFCDRFKVFYGLR